MSLIGHVAPVGVAAHGLQEPPHLLLALQPGAVAHHGEVLADDHLPLPGVADLEERALSAEALEDRRLLLQGVEVARRPLAGAERATTSAASPEMPRHRTTGAVLAHNF